MKVLSTLVGLMALAATLLIFGEAADVRLRKLQPGDVYTQELSTDNNVQATACTKKVFYF